MMSSSASPFVSPIEKKMNMSLDDIIKSGTDGKTNNIKDKKNVNVVNNNKKKPFNNNKAGGGVGKFVPKAGRQQKLNEKRGVKVPAVVSAIVNQSKAVANSSAQGSGSSSGKSVVSQRTKNGNRRMQQRPTKPKLFEEKNENIQISFVNEKAASSQQQGKKAAPVTSLSKRMMQEQNVNGTPGLRSSLYDQSAKQVIHPQILQDGVNLQRSILQTINETLQKAISEEIGKTLGLAAQSPNAMNVDHPPRFEAAVPPRNQKTSKNNIAQPFESGVPAKHRGPKKGSVNNNNNNSNGIRKI